MADKKFDIIAALPAELVLNIFERFPELQVLQLYRVSKTWSERLDGLKWKERIKYCGSHHRDWPEPLPYHLQFSQLSRSVRHLEVSAARLDHSWKDNIVNACPLLETLVIRSIARAPLDGILILTNSRLRSLHLTDVTFAHCKHWLSYLSVCPKLEEIRLSLRIFSTENTPGHRSDSCFYETSGIVPSLRSIAISIPGVTKAEHTGIYGSKPEAMNGRAMLCKALSDLRLRAPKWQTFEITVADNIGLRTPRTFLEDFFADLPTGVAFETIILNGAHCTPEWLRHCTALKLRDIVLLKDLRTHGTNWNFLCNSFHTSVELVYTAHWTSTFHPPLPLSQNLRYLKLGDPQGLLAHALFYILTKHGGLQKPMSSLESLSLSRLPIGEPGNKAGLVGDFQSLALPQDFKSIVEDDFKRLALWFPNLIDVELVQLNTNVEASTIETILRDGLPKLKHLRIECRNSD